MPHFQVTMPGHDNDRTLGDLAAAWIEHFYRHGDGDIRGQRYRLETDFYEFTLACYALDEDGKRLYKVCVLSRPKGTAKSEYAAAVDLFEALGPCRFDGWAKGGEVYEFLDFTYTYLPGEAMGKPITDPIVRIMATEETQTGNTYGNVMAVLNEEGDDNDRSPLADWVESRRDIFAGLTGMKLPGGGKILLSTGGSKSKDGGKETHGTADETHLYTGQLAQMYLTVKRNLNKRKAAEPWLLTTTTMYKDGEGSIGELQHKLAVDISLGKRKNPQMLFDHREGHPIADLSDAKALRASLVEAYAGREWIDYDAMLNDVADTSESLSDWRRYFLNQIAGADEAYVTSAELSAITGTEENPVPPLKKGDTVTLGLDFAPGNMGDGRTHKTGSNSRRKFRVPDSTAIVACRLSDMSLHLIGLWEADEVKALQEGWNPPMLDIENTVHDAFAKYNVIGMFADPTGIEGYLDRWTAKYLKRLQIRASAERPMYRYMSGKSAARSGKDVDALYEAIAGQHVRLAPDMNMARHFLNARRGVTPQGAALYKQNPESPRKIDIAVTSVLAHSCGVLGLNKGLGAAKARGIPRKLR